MTQQADASTQVAAVHDADVPVITLSPRDFDAVLFDLDGVLTRTARVHAAAWKKLFDSYLEQRAVDSGEESRAVVVEDAIAGVEAGRAGKFGYVIGVDRSGQSEALRKAGADAVVTSLTQVLVATEPPSAWSLVFEGFDPSHEGTREALCTLGNGYFATRAAAHWAKADGIHYPGTYLGGDYNRLNTTIAGRVVENEDLVNFPNWLALEFRIADGEWFDTGKCKHLFYCQKLDLRRGLLLRTMRFEDPEGRRTLLKGSFRPAARDEFLHRGAAERCGRHPERNNTASPKKVMITAIRCLTTRWKDSVSLRRCRNFEFVKKTFLPRRTLCSRATSARLPPSPFFVTLPLSASLFYEYIAHLSHQQKRS